MSYDINLSDPVTGETLRTDAPHQIRGGTYALGGTREMWVNITYNYSGWYYQKGVFPDGGEDHSGIRSIYGLTGAESIPVLQNAIAALTALDEDLSDEERQDYELHGATGYWLPTRENAIKPLYSLLAFAKMRPDGVWEGD
jgi:hypothetical protein